MSKYGFRLKIMLYLSIAVLIQAILIGLMFMSDVSDYTSRYKKEVVEENLIAQVGLMNDWIATQEKIIRSYGLVLSKIDENSAEEVINFLDEFLRQELLFRNVFYTTELGKNYISDGKITKVDGRTRYWYKGAMVSEFYISQPYIDSITGEYVVTLSVPVKDKNQKLIGVLGADLMMDDLLNKLTLSQDEYIKAIVMTDKSQKVLYYKNYDLADGKNYEGLSYDQAFNLLEKSNGRIQLGVSDMKADMRVYLKNDRHIMELINYNYEFWISTITGLIGIIIILWYISKVLARPVRNLTFNIQSLTGQLERQDISQEKLDSDLLEIVDLFEKLDSHINDSINQINMMNENMGEANLILEKKNEEFRNALIELNKANVHLKQSEKIYHNLINNIDEMIWIVDLSGKVTFANQKFLNWINYSTVDQVELYLSEFIQEIQNSSEFNKTGFFSKRDFKDLELVLINKTTQKKMDIVASTTIIYYKDKPSSIQFIARDITEEKRLYQQYFHKNREMIILNDISRSLTLKEDLKSVLQLITDRISNLISVSGSSVRMLQNEDTLKIASFSGHSINNLYPEDPHINTSHMGIALLEQRIIALVGREDMIIKDEHLEQIIDKLGAVYYFPLYNRDNRFGVLTVIADQPLDADKIRLLKSLSENASTAIEKATLFDKLKKNYFMTIEALSNALEEKVFNYKNHTKRVAEFSKMIAERFYLSDKDLNDIYISGLLHDIGKLGISDEVLRHEDLLTADEAFIMKTHVEIGRRIIEPIGLNSQIVEGIYLHHKNYDLSGYPEDIDIQRLPLFARIIGVADAFDSELIEARTSEEWQLELVYNQLDLDKDRLYCPDVLAALWELILEDRERVIKTSEI